MKLRIETPFCKSKKTEQNLKFATMIKMALKNFIGLTPGLEHPFQLSVNLTFRCHSFLQMESSQRIVVEYSSSSVFRTVFVDEK